MAKLPQQLHVIQRQNQELRCELCGGEHSSEQCAYQNISSEEKAFYMEDQGKQGTFQQLQLLDPVSQERMRKMEDSIEKFTHTMLVVQKNVDNFETQIKQLTQELRELREKCKSITTRSGVVVGKGIGDNLQNLPYPHAPSRKNIEGQFVRFCEILKQLEIIIPFTEASEHMPTYARFMKELLTKKRRLKEQGIVELEAGCSAIIKKSLPQKSKDPGSFTLPVTIRNFTVAKALLDLGASINLMPLSMLKKIGDVEIFPTRMTLQLADRSIKYPHGIVEDLLVKVDKFYFPVDFVIMDIEEDVEVPLILGRPFLKTAKIMIDVDEGKLKREIFIDDSLMKAVLNDNENCEDWEDKEVKECLLELGKAK
ncbi:uncharacterized protein [Phaseolus vulgaris]|uniref:uncharacterized protein n=1 Tax=Phaseolus vulgaris TaxID=3885 RepID=UPI0035CAE6F3